ncbi:MAG: sigma 54-interacting transcriptional regulator [Bacillota bacterium]
MPILCILQILSQGLQEGVHVINRSGETVLYNEACGRIEGLDPKDALGKNILDIYPSLTEDTSVLFQVMRTGRPVENLTQTLTNFRGRVITTVNSSYPVMGRHGIWGALEISNDVRAAWEISDRMIELQAQISGGRRKPAGAHGICGSRQGFDAIVTCDDRMRQVVALGRQAAKAESPVLIYGETGTGKEVFVKAIHAESSRRAGPLVLQNCAALPETLLEAALFGTKSGAFTGAQDRPGLFELADKGILYLDELASASLSLQAKLLRVLEEKNLMRVGGTTSTRVDVRVVASLNIPPGEAIKRGLLREDIYYRLAVICLELPPLRHRKRDIPVLVRHFLDLCAADFGHSKEVSPEALRLILTHNWPGNARELKNMLEGAAALAEGDVIEPQHLSLLRRHTYSSQYISWPDHLGGVKKAQRGDPGGLRGMIGTYEREILVRALANCGGNISAAARLLGVPRQTLWSKIRRHGLCGPDQDLQD